MDNVVVAKFGGSSMARPDLVTAHMLHPNNTAHTIVVSAPGKDDEYHIKMTDMLLQYKAAPSVELAGIIQARFNCLADVLDRQRTNTDVRNIVDTVPFALRCWQQRQRPVEALGELLTAQMLATFTDRECVTADKLICLDTNGTLKTEPTVRSVMQRLTPRGRYVVPGFYGADQYGSIVTMPRGGSDITGAVIALALGMTYHNWSDVPGFMTQHPRYYTQTELIKKLSYDQAITMAQNGCELLHPLAARLLRGTGITTIMRNTFATSDQFGTIVS